MSGTEPSGVPTGGDAHSPDLPTGNDGTAGEDAPSGDAGVEDASESATAAPAAPVDDREALREAFEANDALGGADPGAAPGDEA